MMRLIGRRGSTTLEDYLHPELRADTVTGRLTSNGRPADIAGGRGRDGGRQRNSTGNFISDQIEVRRVSLSLS